MPVKRPSHITIGRVVKAHGVHGEAKVEPLTNDPSRFRALKRVFLVSPGGERQEVKVLGVRMIHDGVLIQLAGYDSPEKVRSIQGSHLEVPREEALLPPPGQTMFADMIGLRAIDAQSGVEIGPIKAIVTAGNELLEISAPSGDLLIPWVEQFVKAVDLESGTVLIQTIPGLLEG